MVRTRNTLLTSLTITAGFLAMAALAGATPKDYDLLNYVPADNYHVAASALPAQIFAAPVTNQILGEPWPQRLQAHLQGLQTLTGIDARKDLDAVVLAGNPPRRGGKHGEGVAIVQGRFTKERILQSLAKAPQYTEKTVAGKTCYAFFAARENESRAVAFLSDNVLVLGSVDAVEAVLQHGAAAEGSLGAEGTLHALAAKIPADAAFWLVARTPESLPARFPARPFMEHVKGLAGWGTLSDTVALEGIVTTDSADSAKDLGEALEGGLALARLGLTSPQAAEHPGAKTLQTVVDKVQWKVEQNDLAVKVTLTADQVRALKAMKERIHERREAGKGQWNQGGQRARPAPAAAPAESK